MNTRSYKITVTFEHFGCKPTREDFLRCLKQDLVDPAGLEIYEEDTEGIKIVFEEITEQQPTRGGV